jgi:hypothetical protein
MAARENLTVRIGEDGVFLKFTAQDGSEAELNVESLATQFDEATRNALLAWCQDRRKEPPRQRLGEQRGPLLAQDYAD